jgi:hypothetical protein
MVHISNIMEESIYTKKEKSNKIFENNENLQNLIGSTGAHNVLNSTMTGPVKTNKTDKRSASD